jgi:hypothetical protein
MPAQPIADWVQARIWTVKAHRPKLSAGKISELLEAELKADGKADQTPSESTVKRYLKRWDGLPEEERNRYRLFYWPESMQSHALPWEAAPAALEMLSAEADRRPLLIVARWFWRLTQSAADAPYKQREQVARQLAACEIVGAGANEARARAIECWLTFSPWRSKEHAAAYQRAQEERGIAPLLPGWVSAAPGMTEEQSKAMIEALQGRILSWPQEGDTE